MAKIPPGCELTQMQSITYLTVDPFNPADGYTVDKDLKFGNSSAGARQIAGDVATVAGSDELYQLHHNPTFAYVLHGYDGGTIDEANAAAKQRIFVGKIQLIMHALWLVKDNSANPLRAFLRVLDIQGPHYRVDSFSTQFTMADCNLRVVHFTRSEFERGIAYYRQFWDILPQVPENESRLSKLAMGSRVARAIYFVQGARNTGDLLIKLAFYAMALEALLTTGDGRHGHDVPTRASQIIGKTKRERKAPYGDVHALYGYRSDVVHGRKFNERDLLAIRDTVVRCDEHVRRILTAILTDASLLKLFQDGSAKALAAHFSKS